MTVSIPDNAPIAIICAMDNELIHLQTILPQADEDWVEYLSCSPSLLGISNPDSRPT